jgi:hypothetical protein
MLRACVLLHERAHQQQLCAHGVCRQGPARVVDELWPRRAGGPGRAQAAGKLRWPRLKLVRGVVCVALICMGEATLSGRAIGSWRRRAGPADHGVEAGSWPSLRPGRSSPELLCVSFLAFMRE